MCCGTANQEGVKCATTNQAAAAFVCVFFLAVFLFSNVFIALYANHEHDHSGANETCAACAQMTLSENILKMISNATAASTCFVCLLCATVQAHKAASAPVVIHTLIQLKVRADR